MSEPNYQYCALFCAGVIKDCPHYEPYTPFRVCKTYRLIDSIVPNHKFELSKSKLEKIIKAARGQ